ncbi:hypothetical protein ALC60_13085, partial [Trachymyrmex zeteki]
VIGRQLGVSNATVHRVLKRELLYPFHRFFFWSHLKKIVYATELASPEEVIGRMQGAVQTIDEPMVRRVRQNLILRAEACIEVRGAHFEQLL